MHKHPNLTEGRIAQTLGRIQGLIHSKPAPISIAAYHVHGEPIPATEALAKKYTPFAVGQPWGAMWNTTWFRFSGTIPRQWKGREVAAQIKLGFKGGEGFTVEGLVWQNGVPTRAINVNRTDVPLTNPARGAEAFEFYIEAAANPRAAMHLVADLCGPDPHGQPLFVLEQAEIVFVNREAFDFYYDFKVACETMSALSVANPSPDEWRSAGIPGLATDPRRGQLMYALNTAVNLFDESDPATIAPARKALREVLNKHNGDTTHQISAIGHAHIDTAWLWPLRETIRKCARTFSTALAYMEEYPDYVFGCSQPQQYAWMKEYYPAIFEGVKKAVKRGQWEPTGSMWIEADCNLSSGESLVRQILHGKNFFLDEFGYETRDVWIPDVFGYAAALPQIMHKAGVDSFVTQKISWNQFNKFPHHTFWWEGIDGTRIFTHFPPADNYNCNFSPKQLIYNVQNFKENDRATRSLYLYGHGDGGGGPTKEMLEIAKRVGDLEGLPKVKLERVAEFMPKAKKDAKDLPVWIGELYFELHRATYTTQARNKRGNRKSEFLLRDAEFFDTVLGAAHIKRSALKPHTGERAVYDVIAKDKHTPAAYLDRAWKLVLLNQFHDIIPGSSINWVYQDSARDYATIRALGSAVIDAAQGSLAAAINTSAFKRPVVIFNTTSHALNSVVSLPDGSPVFASVPACGYTVIEGHQKHPVSTPAVPVKASQQGKTIILDNGLLRVVFNSSDGLIRSILDHRANREVLSGQRGNVFQLHRDHPNFWDAWDVDLFYRETCEDITALESITLEEETDLRACVRVVRKFGESSITQKITLCAGSPRIDFHTEIDWHENHKFLKVAFPVNVRSPRATYEIQFGHTERPTHYNTSWDMARFEVCAQKWADLSEGDYGVALLNDCKYGHDIFGNVMRLSLLRAPTAPDPVADRGHHEFTYSLLPHPGDFRAGKVVQEAYALNIPLRVVPVDPHTGTLPDTQSFFQVDREGVVIEAVKKAEKENAIIVRLYEAYGTRGAVNLKTSLPFTEAFASDLMERTLRKVAFKNGKVTLQLEPFEIVTLKFPIK
ncbi:MAG: alpha-mannosidase [Methylacidiphilales bacterium]|nr:alpha-mannosidase [Candidatus Methylacidiphilales bacterium]